jgi:hypothetical protein
VADDVLPVGLASDLANLKLRLAGMVDDELPTEQAALLAQEISAIRLHLKRLALERDAIRARHEAH